MRIIIALIFVLLTIVGLLVNAGRKIFIWLRPLFSGISPLLYGILYGAVILIILGLFIISRVPDNSVPRMIIKIGHHALGFLVYIVMWINAADFLLFLGKLVRLLPAPLPKQTTFITGAAVLIIAICALVYGTIHSLSVRTRSYEVQLYQAEGAVETDSLQIALISDLHLGYIIEEKHVQKVVKAVNAINPDIVCIAGDIFDGDITSLKNPEVLQRLLGEIHAPYGVYACLGNHDAGTSYQQMLEFLSEVNIQLLLDEAVVIDNRFILAGRRDSSPIGGQGDKRGEFIIPGSAGNLPIIVMDHQPSNITEYEDNADLILSGHTHRGQMFPFNLITKAIFDVDYGHYQMPDNGPQVIVTSGAGTWGPPQTIGTDNEIVSIKVVFPRIAIQP